MKEVRGIKGLSIGAIIANGALLALMINLFLQFSRFPAGMKSFQFITMMIITVLIIIAITYPAQLLFMRKKYYRYVPVTSAARIFLHITRIIQFLFSLFMAFALAASLSDLFKYNRPLIVGNSAFYLQAGILLLLLIAVVLNLLIFFKGWRLLKLVRSNYIDEVMNAFD